MRWANSIHVLQARFRRQSNTKYQPRHKFFLCLNNSKLQCCRSLYILYSIYYVYQFIAYISRSSASVAAAAAVVFVKFSFQLVFGSFDKVCVTNILRFARIRVNVGWIRFMAWWNECENRILYEKERKSVFAVLFFVFTLAARFDTHTCTRHLCADWKRFHQNYNW